MSRFWSAAVKQLTPYVPGEQPKLANLIKLNTNENPFGPSPKVLEAMRAATSDALRLYPDPSASALKRTLADYHGVDSTQVFVGNGSDEVLGFVFMALLKHDKPLLFPDITYSFYPVYCKLFGIDYRTVPLNEAMEIDPADYRPGCGAIIFPNPNAPTGIGMTRSSIEAMLAAHPDAVLVVDEAYIDFGGDSAIALTVTYPNLLVVQTLSKSRSLAGLRVGFAIGHPDLIEALERVKNSFNSYPLDRPAQAGAIASFDDEAYFRHTRAAVIALRDSLSAQLAQLGFSVLPSQANFVFVSHPDHDAAQLAARLRERSILVRHFNLPRIGQYLRISIGNGDECAALVTALTELLHR
ncbi:histidinol-phosphate transaminase [Janthinobacterium agaricidamnosum]|uniref:Histidinol-phosphate aminotransferase n=1 Tax=Janthinobacterium agaricidamnosum NBRC 102515 = DSM 9628 TaxID=1349767 RepID=W0V8P9_9BURK|nr:histidinol-phosphate transaminase [Janthinobacterium agaricidamnosum]CDG83652.1 histidinol-phosphate aminotransferase [Janthinobacterium agaricidamnosum NBRC 102515 = DSM 9628]